MGAVANMTGNKLLRAMIASVPFVDVMSAMTDPLLPLTKHEYDEWGDPEEEDVRELLQSYDPYSNVSRQEYPNMLVSASKIDVRVPYWGPAKWVAKMRKERIGDSTILFKVKFSIFDT